MQGTKLSLHTSEDRTIVCKLRTPAHGWNLRLKLKLVQQGNVRDRGRVAQPRAIGNLGAAHTMEWGWKKMGFSVLRCYDEFVITHLSCVHLLQYSKPLICCLPAQLFFQAHGCKLTTLLLLLLTACSFPPTSSVPRSISSCLCEKPPRFDAKHVGLPAFGRIFVAAVALRSATP